MQSKSPLAPPIAPLIRRTLRSSFGPSPLHLALLALSAAGCGSAWKSEDVHGDGFTVQDGQRFHANNPDNGGQPTGRAALPRSGPQHLRAP